jgi:hypothetical protein
MSTNLKKTFELCQSLFKFFVIVFYFISQIQRELGDGVMKDDACGDEAPKGFAGYCK